MYIRNRTKIGTTVRAQKYTTENWKRFASCKKNITTHGPMRDVWKRGRELCPCIKVECCIIFEFRKHHPYSCIRVRIFRISPAFGGVKHILVSNKSLCALPHFNLHNIVWPWKWDSQRMSLWPRAFSQVCVRA